MKYMLKEVKIVTYVPATLQLISMIACQKRKEHKLSTYVCEIKVQCFNVKYSTKGNPVHDNRP